MFAQPPQIEAKVFARVPDALRIRGRTSRWAQTHRSGAVTDCFLEGPSFDRGGDLYMVDVAWGRILRMSPTGDFSVVTEYDGSPNGLKFHADGRIFVADFTRGLLALEPGTGKMTTVVDGYEGKPFHGLNDLHFSCNGDLYFTDQGLSGLHDPFGRLFRLRADGRLNVVLDRVPSPNGLVLDRSETTIFLNVTRDNAVWRVPMHSDGTAYKVGAFIRLTGGIGPDGLAMDAEGSLAIAHLGLGCIWLFNTLGEPLLRINSPTGRMTTNVTFGGEGNRTLFITESETGSILTAELDVPGHPMFSQL
ncbi:MAG: SMP-30/gluconolactonase/LRE family protein [Mesorhizobium sp.]|uniref:SMP-30/gluconolactonase/LRE family protein n=1 Tax=Mesorhizobium sp. TaxID=1871066 RepID=UPI000FE79C56|nr:MAG: SMP-30/gluconolactonase/LRE family protein [Mesorhizobium sp.]